MQFCLHLSSASISQVSSCQRNEIPHLRNHEMNKCLSQKSVSKSPAITHGLACQYSCEAQAPRLNNSTAVLNKNVSCEPNSDQPIKPNQNIGHECHGKLDGQGLNNNVADDVVELSIAASEAVVISEMMSGSMQFDSFSDSAIIEIALRVKHARNECTLETSHAFSFADPDDIDQLSDLDEASMSDAFEDVGITVQQVAETSRCPFSCRKSSNSTQGSDARQLEILKPESSFSDNVLAGDFGDDEKTPSENIKSVHTADCKLQLNSMRVEFFPQTQSKSLDNLPLDYSIPTLKDHAPELEQNLHIKDALPANQLDSMEHQCIQKDGKVSQPNNAKVRKGLKLFKWETSFLSESMDSLGQDVSQTKPSVELATVSSSNMALQVSPSGFCKEKEQNHEAPLSQDYSRSLLLSDPLCSVVPCSISNEVYVGYETRLAMDGVEKSNNPMAVIYSKCLHGNPTVQYNVMLQKPYLESREFILSETKFEQPNIPHRKQLNSLRPYSLGIDSLKKAEKGNSPCKQLPLHSTYGAVTYSSSERIIECSNKNDIVLPGKCLAAGKSNNERILEQNKFVVQSLAIQGTDNDDTQTAVHEDACSSPIQEGCKVTIGGDRHESMKRLSTSALGKYRSEDSSKKACYRTETISSSHIPVQSNLHSFLEDKRHRKKRVRFLEAAHNMGGFKASKLQTKSIAHCSCSGVTMPCKADSRWDRNYYCLPSNRTVKNNGMILQGLEFLLTGFLRCKAKDLEELIRRYGGYVLPNIPSNSPYLSGKIVRSASRKLPVILCPNKVQTTKYLYGCAVNAFMLIDHWLEDSIQAGIALPPKKYMTRPIPGSKGNKLIMGESFWRNNGTPLFHKVGMIIHGKVKFCAKFMKIVKYGGGQVFKSLQRLVQSLRNGRNTLAVILVKNESSVSRHLKHCALEHDIPTMPASWIINSLFCGKLLPPKRDRCASLHRIKMPSFPEPQVDVDMSQEI